MSSPYIDETQTIIAVMGTTGVGKSTFIKYATGGDVQIGDKLTACKVPHNIICKIVYVDNATSGTGKCAVHQIPDTNV